MKHLKSRFFHGVALRLSRNRKHLLLNQFFLFDELLESRFLCFERTLPLIPEPLLDDKARQTRLLCQTLQLFVCPVRHLLRKEIHEQALLRPRLGREFHFLARLSLLDYFPVQAFFQGCHIRLRCELNTDLSFLRGPFNLAS